MPEFLTTELIIGILVALFGGWKMFGDKLPDMNNLLSSFKKGEKKVGEPDKISNLNKIWSIREEFDEDCPVYENLTQAIENIIRCDKEVKGE